MKNKTHGHTTNTYHRTAVRPAAGHHRVGIIEMLTVSKVGMTQRFVGR